MLINVCYDSSECHFLSPVSLEPFFHYDWHNVFINGNLFEGIRESIENEGLSL